MPLNQTLESFLLATINNVPDIDEDDEENNNSDKTQLTKEGSKLEKDVIKITLSGNTEETLKPNSGQAVGIREHHICVGCHTQPRSDYEVWEWHEHIILFDEENGYNPEYIYGNYFERSRVGTEKMKPKEEVTGDDNKEGKLMKSGLKEHIESGEDSGSGSHHNMNVGSSRV